MNDNMLIFQNQNDVISHCNKLPIQDRCKLPVAYAIYKETIKMNNERWISKSEALKITNSVIKILETSR